MSGFEILSMVCSVMQVISFTKEVLTLCKDAYDGRQTIDSQMEENAVSIQVLLDDMRHRSSHMQQQTKDFQDVYAIAQKCSKAAQELQKEIQQVTKHHKPGDIMRAFIAGYKSKISKNVGDADISSFMVSHTKSDASELQRHEDFTALSDTMKYFICQLATGHTEMANLMARDGDQTRQHIQQSEARVKQSINDIHDGANKEAKRMRLLGSLKYESMNSRQTELKPAHEATYVSIFESLDRDEKLDDAYDFLDHVLSEFLLVTNKDHIGDWEISELQSIFLSILLQCKQSIFFLIDGLDEATETEEILQFLDSFIGLQNIKICMSSRSEDIFLEKFSKYDGFKLHELTKDDMLQFASVEIPDTDRYPSDFLQKLRRLLVQKAEGLPSRLEELYADMWSRLGDDEDIYQKQAVRYFSLLIKNQSLCEQTAGLLSITQPVWEVDDDFWMDINPVSVAIKEEFSQLSEYITTSVNFIHRTVLDFFKESEVGKTILAQSKAQSTGLELGTTMLCQLRTIQQFGKLHADQILIKSENSALKNMAIMHLLNASNDLFESGLLQWDCRPKWYPRPSFDLLLINNPVVKEFMHSRVKGKGVPHATCLLRESLLTRDDNCRSGLYNDDAQESILSFYGDVDSAGICLYSLPKPMNDIGTTLCANITLKFATYESIMSLAIKRGNEQQLFDRARQLSRIGNCKPHVKALFFTQLLRHHASEPISIACYRFINQNVDILADITIDTDYDEITHAFTITPTQIEHYFEQCERVEVSELSTLADEKLGICRLEDMGYQTSQLNPKY
ncbi:hypothetical protein THAR02_06335 [Trichoderma harzianum]|uniref:Nephrocystin 3-like N-terminal domain-containing protein n=1 Tax=Trichoderma harzianum TaxID=5544 RepID=A0A0F9XAQ1_TRIHA|nr:hypothetical protein THAR02_06335 [Trichoderma harzianum]